MKQRFILCEVISYLEEFDTAAAATAAMNKLKRSPNGTVYVLRLPDKPDPPAPKKAPAKKRAVPMPRSNKR